MLNLNTIGNSPKVGLGDCLLVAACAQEYYKKYNKKLKYVTSPIVRDILKENPYFQIVDNCKVDLTLKWYSEINRSNLSKFHTLQRFSMQMGFYIDPTAVVDIYLDGNHILNTPSKKYVCLNSLANERTRRYIPEKYVDFMVDYIKSKGYEVIWTGDNYTSDTVKDVKACALLYKDCSLFIGPVSFQYHLAAAVRAPSLLFCSYMPFYKYSHFIMTDHVYSTRNCVYRCEEKCDDNDKQMRRENDCLEFCRAVDYDETEIIVKLNKYLK